MNKDKTDWKHLRVIDIYDEIVTKSGEYAPYLSKEYFVTNTIHECITRGITKVSRNVVYVALGRKKELCKLNRVFQDECI